MKIISTLLLAITCWSANAQDYWVEGGEVKAKGEIIFETGSAKLSPANDVKLGYIKKYLDDKPAITLLRVEGHTESLPNASATNDKTYQLLSEQRALAICKRLVEMGVDCKRLVAVGFGNQKPIAENNTPEGRAANRRYTFVHVALRGHLIGGMPADGGGKVAGEVCQ